MNNKNRYNRKSYSEPEIDALIDRIDELHSLFSDKIFNEKNQWSNDIVRHLDENSCNLFYYKLYIKNNIRPICYNNKCNSELLYDSFSYKSGYKFSNKGFQKYCPICSKNEVWKQKLYNNKDYSNISCKIQKSKRKWIESDAGRDFYIKLGQSNSKTLKLYFKTDIGKERIAQHAKKQSITMKQKILDGTWTPNINNYWTNWASEISLNGEIHKFRSSWDACFWFSNQNLKYENVRIPYNDKIYIADFYDNENKILYELKPKYRFLIEKEKMDGVIDWCFKNSVKFIWVNENNILNYINESIFSNENLKQLDMLKKGIM